MRANLYHQIGVVNHNKVEVHQRVLILLLEVPFGEVVAYLGQGYGLLGDGFHTEIVHYVLVGVVAVGAFGAFHAEIIDFGEVHLVYHVAFHLVGAETVGTVLVGDLLIFVAVGANETHLNAAHQLHRFLVAHIAFDAIQQRRQVEREDVVLQVVEAFAFEFGLFVVRVGKVTVRREIAVFVVIYAGVGEINDTHFVERGVDRHSKVLGFRPRGTFFPYAEKVEAAEAGQTVGREVKHCVLIDGGEHLTTGGVHIGTKVLGGTEVVGDG